METTVTVTLILLLHFLSILIKYTAPCAASADEKYIERLPGDLKKGNYKTSLMAGG